MRREDALHEAVADLLRHVIGEPGVCSADGVLWTSRELRTKDAAQGRNCKRRGCAAGMPDVDLSYRPDPCPDSEKGLVEQFGIELKTESGTVSKTQRERHLQLRRAGWSVAVCRSTDDVLTMLRVWDIPHRGVR